MRTKNSLYNIFYTLLSQVVIILLGFLSRKIFIDHLGSQYLGINGLLTNVLSLLGLVESGIGVSIVYNLYKPLAEENRVEVIALIQLYKKCYMYLAALVGGLSLVIFPIMLQLITFKTSITYITIAYFIFVFRNILTYLYAHKWSLITADQKGYVLTASNILFTIVTLLMRIGILLVTNNYLLYLIIEVLVLIVQNFINGILVDRRYPYIKTSQKYSVNNDIKVNLIQNIKALFLHNIGSYCVFGTDNLLIGYFINVVTIGLYSNYVMIISQLSALLAPVLSGINASVGNLIAIEKEEKTYFVFKVSYLINFWLYSIGSIFLFNLLQPFIQLWLGPNQLLDDFTLIILIINFYITGMRTSIFTFKTKAGIFVQDKYVPLLEAVINLGAAIFLVRYFGLAGIFIATTISTLSIVFWNVPRLVYKYVFKRNLWTYFYHYFLYALLTIFSGYITYELCETITTGHSFVSLMIRGIICITIPNIIYLLVFLKSAEFQYMIKILRYHINELKRINKNRTIEA